ncbi:MAG: hypothetical protein WCT44_01610 [Candidatus Paceibacterota bacterium]
MQEEIFQKHTGKETAVQISEEKLLDDTGGMGNIFTSIVNVRGKPKQFVIKKYNKSYFSEKKSQELVRHAFEMYVLAKNSGLKVFPTFRIGTDGKSILMTDGFLNDQICIGSNGRFNMYRYGEEFMKKTVALEFFLNACFQEALDAAAKGFKFAVADIYFFLLSKQEPRTLDFVIGDFDNLKKAEPSFETVYNNLRQVRIMLSEFFYNNIDTFSSADFIEKIDECYEKKLQETQKVII